MKGYSTPQIEQIAAALASETITLDIAAQQLSAEIISISGDYRGLIIPNVLLYSAAGGASFSISRAVLDEYGYWRTDFLGHIKEGNIDGDGQWEGEDEDVISHAINAFGLAPETRGYEA
jgi:hypothetical protein